ncbi:sugar phosphate isomerase/epimerase family protein [Alkaliphilus peptidifermentans]|uniref:Sugar phosphate isomerase/epimerase n=1 Tax=Alkaliphilus peptidifermentans DSM 18978 TaxID=1120976 RepID=A0A1G5E2D0_9FIRM|nr:sugar phosphate isomerase/epimerase [Alkaliphilus peptidifermentans]SCY21142.1 Sugar phosphate isomerase/epimerase [Alkaliphilus peptidifermentans DSM 18978]
MIRKYGIRAHDLGILTPEQILNKLDELKLDGVQLAPVKVFDTIKRHEMFMEGDFSSFVCQLFKECQKEILMLGCYLNHAHPDSEQQRHFLDISKGYINIAALNNIKCVGTESFTLNANGKPHKEDHSQVGYNHFIKQLEPLIAYAEERQVDFAIEPAVHHIIYDIKTMTKLIHDIGSKRVKVIFDPVNLMTQELKVDQRRFFETFFEAFDNRISMVHVKDFAYLGHEKQMLTAGQGELDYGYLHQMIKKSQQAIDVMLEGVSPELTLSAIRNMKQLDF